MSDSTDLYSEDVVYCDHSIPTYIADAPFGTPLFSRVRYCSSKKLKVIGRNRIAFLFQSLNHKDKIRALCAHDDLSLADARAADIAPKYNDVDVRSRPYRPVLLGFITYNTGSDFRKSILTPEVCADIPQRVYDFIALKTKGGSLPSHLPKHLKYRIQPKTAKERLFNDEKRKTDPVSI